MARGTKDAQYIDLNWCLRTMMWTDASGLDKCDDVSGQIHYYVNQFRYGGKSISMNPFIQVCLHAGLRSRRLNNHLHRQSLGLQFSLFFDTVCREVKREFFAYTRGGDRTRIWYRLCWSEARLAAQTSMPSSRVEVVGSDHFLVGATSISNMTMLQFQGSLQ